MAATSLCILLLPLIAHLSLGSTDDDWVISPKLPFCRKGHSAVKGFSEDKHFLIIYGGEGLNYKESSSKFLNDIWTLELDSSDPQKVSFRWEQQSSYPMKRFGFSTASNGEGGMILYGGMDASSKSSSYLHDLWNWEPPNSKINREFGVWTRLIYSQPGNKMISTQKDYDNRNNNDDGTNNDDDFFTVPSPRIGMEMVCSPSSKLLYGLGGKTVTTGYRQRTETFCLSDFYCMKFFLLTTFRLDLIFIPLF